MKLTYPRIVIAALTFGLTFALTSCSPDRGVVIGKEFVDRRYDQVSHEDRWIVHCRRSDGRLFDLRVAKDVYDGVTNGQDCRKVPTTSG